MFVVIGHNSVQREISAFTVNSQMFHRPQIPEKSVVFTALAAIWLNHLGFEDPLVDTPFFPKVCGCEAERKGL